MHDHLQLNCERNYDMANHDDKKTNPTTGDKVEKVAQIGQLVLGAVLTSLQIFFAIRHAGKPPLPV